MTIPTILITMMMMIMFMTIIVVNRYSNIAH